MNKIDWSIVHTTKIIELLERTLDGTIPDPEDSEFVWGLFDPESIKHCRNTYTNNRYHVYNFSEEQVVENILSDLIIELPDSLNSDLVAHVWGGEGEGSSIGFVLDLDGRYFKVSGYYNSWVGTNWEDAEVVEVVPKQKVITVYEEV